MQAFANKRKSSQRCCNCSGITKALLCCLCSVLVLLILGAISFLVINTLIIPDPFTRRVLSTDPPTFANFSDEDARLMASRLAGAVRIPSVSFNKDVQDDDALERLNVYIHESFPLLHGAEFVKFQRVNNFSRLYRVAGSGSHEEAGSPYLLCAHLDVVPAGLVDSWSHHPFEGGVVVEEAKGEEFIFGRGVLDDKQNVFAILEALEHRIRTGERPARTFYIALGHDEEVGGDSGAKEIAKVLSTWLEEHDESLEFISDEGMFIVVDEILPGVTGPVAFIGVVEKGMLTLNLTVHSTQGHSSLPPPESAIGILSGALARLEGDPQPSRFGQGPEADIVRYLAPHASSFLHRIVYSNLCLFSPLLSRLFAASPTGDAMQRTTTALTVFTAGFKENVLPPSASALVNLRLHPADDLETVLDNVRERLDDERVNVTVSRFQPPSPTSEYSGEGRSSMSFHVVANSVLDVFPEAKIVPGMLMANTDTRHYLGLSRSVFRFSPMELTTDDVKTIHGIDEKISVKAYQKVVQYYLRLIANADNAGPSNDDTTAEDHIPANATELHNGVDADADDDLTEDVLEDVKKEGED